jgi:hypothetical protein
MTVKAFRDHANFPTYLKYLTPQAQALEGALLRKVKNAVDELRECAVKGMSEFTEGSLYASKSTASTLKSRHIPVPINVTLTEATKTTTNDNRVRVLVGESGKGKTMAMLKSARKGDFVVLMTASDVFNEGSDLPPEKERATRNTNAIKLLLSRMSETIIPLAKFKAAAQEFQKDGKPMTLHILVDELGSAPTLVRALCGCRNDLENEINSQLDVKDTVKVCLMLAGTGCDAASAAPGSYPDDFSIVTLGECKVWNALLNLLREDEHPLYEYLVASKMATDLGQNARVAALMYRIVSRVTSFTPSLSPMFPRGMGYKLSPRAASSLLSVAFISAALQYKQLNAMNSTQYSEVQDVFQRAAHSVMFPHLKGLPDSDMKFIRSNGVITDNARWIQRD